MAVTAAIEEQRRLLAGAQATSKAARRALARLPASVPPSVLLAEGSATTVGSAPATADDESDGRVPPVVDGEAWRTEFLR
jgi:hypothetical protein